MSQAFLARHVSARAPSALSRCCKGATFQNRQALPHGELSRGFITSSSIVGYSSLLRDCTVTFPVFESRTLTNPVRWASVRFIRREPISQAQRNAEMEEEAKKIDLAPHKLLEKGEAGTMQGIIKDVIPVGYFITLPSGRDGYLPALDLGFTGGIVILERLFKVGQELTVRVVRRGGGGREILSIKKPEFAPNTDPRFVFSQSLANTTGRS